MKNKIKLFQFFIFLYLIGSPVYGAGYEEINMFKTILQLIFYLGIFIVVILLSIYGTRFVAKNYKRVISSKYMELLDILNIPGGSKIVLVKVKDRIYVLSIANGSTSVIDKLNQEEFHTIEEDFDNYLDRYLNKWNNGLRTNRILSKFYSKKDKEDFNDEE